MAADQASKNQKIKNPAVSFEKPIDVVKDKELSDEEKKQALNTWEQDARQLLTASNEGMPGSDEGLRAIPHQFGKVVRAKDKLGEKPKHKPSQ